MLLRNLVKFWSFFGSVVLVWNVILWIFFVRVLLWSMFGVVFGSKMFDYSFPLSARLMSKLPNTTPPLCETLWQTSQCWGFFRSLEDDPPLGTSRFSLWKPRFHLFRITSCRHPAMIRSHGGKYSKGGDFKGLAVVFFVEKLVGYVKIGPYSKNTDIKKVELLDFLPY